MSPLFYAVLSTLVVSLVALVGIISLSIKRAFLEKILFLLISLSAGALLGDVFFHLLPEVIHESGGLEVQLALMILVGIVGFFVLEKFFIWHHHHMVETPEEHEQHKHSHPYSIGLMNLVGDSLHNLLDGMIIGASYLISPVVGIGTTVAVILHEIPQEMGDFGVLIHSGYSVKKALFFNFLTALFAVLGALISISLGVHYEEYLFYLVPLTAGAFIYIACSDLIPELKKQKEVKRSLFQLVALIVGMVLMYGLIFIESENHGSEEMALDVIEDHQEDVLEP